MDGGDYEKGMQILIKQLALMQVTFACCIEHSNGARACAPQGNGMLSQLMSSAGCT